jgi:RNA polymerase sigma factor (sigma-70 family)
MTTGSDAGQVSLDALQKENEQLQERVKWLENILHQVPAMLYSYNNNNKAVTWCNERLSSTLGYSSVEMQGRGIDFFKDIMHPEDFKLASVAQQSFRDKKEHFGGLARVRKKGEANYRWLLGLEVPFTYNNENEVEEILCAFLDLTNAMDTNIQLSEALNAILRRQHENLFNKLTSREKDILSLAAKGMNNKEIASSLNLSRYTVETHRKNIRLKLKVRNTSELVAIARKIGIG